MLKNTPRFFLCVLIFSSLLVSPVFAAVQAKIILVEGSVQYKNPGDTAWKKAQSGILLRQGAEILVSQDASCEFRIGKSAAKLNANSRAVLKSLDPVEIQLFSGRIFSLVKDLKSNKTFSVATPTAIAAARGTGWAQDMDSIEVFDATVHLTGQSGESMDVNEDMGIDIAADGDLGEPVPLPDDVKQELDAFEQAIQQHVVADIQTEFQPTGIEGAEDIQKFSGLETVSEEATQATQEVQEQEELLKEEEADKKTGTGQGGY